MQLSLLFLTILSTLALILRLFRVTLVIRDHCSHLLSITIAHTHSCPQLLLLSTRRGVQLFFPRVYIHMDSIPPLPAHDAYVENLDGGQWIHVASVLPRVCAEVLSSTTLLG